MPGNDIHIIKEEPDTALLSLVMLARICGLAADPSQLKHKFGHPGRAFTTRDMIRAARHIGLKAKEVASDRSRLAHLQLPALAQYRDGRFVILAKAEQDKVLIHCPLEQRPRIVTLDEFEQQWTGRLILCTRRDAATDALSHFDFTWFIPAIVKYRHLLGDVLVASFFIQLFALITPLFFQVVIDKVLVHRGLTTLDVLAIGLLAVSLFEVVLGGLRTYLFSHTTNRVDVELGARLFHHLLALPLAYFESRRVGDSVARVRELENIRNFLTGSSITVVIDLLFTVVFLAVMYYYSPILTYVVLGAIPFYIVLSIVITPILRARLNEKFNRGAENQAFLVESVSGIETVKAMAVEPQMQRRWENQLAGYVGASFRASNLGNIASQSASFINKVTTVLILWIGAHLVIKGDLSVGQLVAFNMLAGRVSGPVLRLVQLWQEFQQAGISVQRLGDILNTHPEAARTNSGASLPAIQGRISFERISFRYAPDRPEVLRNVSLEVPPGQVLGIVGRSGSGKSTLAKLAQRMYVPESGRVLVDGVDLSMVDPAWLRRQIGVVLQENILFNTSVRDNIALADPGLPMEAVIRAAQQAGAHEFILELSQGYDTLVGEHGCNLSGGQRQRIAIARALVTNPRVLIFDEATSALDYESERIIQENMARICQGRTVMIIAHRLSALRSAARIIVIDKGQISEEGTHEELLRKGGYYARLHASQSSRVAVA
ncbi:MAG: peptidase C39 [Gammaproteobacteria bacterium RBG_16_57_12]|nr:MAG: peptidase C39 [Gammaproteobacteria bacterium RBG_16_57_12]